MKAIAVLIIFSMILFAGCAGQQEQPPQQPAQQPSKQNNPTVTVPQPENPAPAISALVSCFQSSRTWKVTYEVSSSGSPVSGNMLMIQYNIGDNRLRSDFSVGKLQVRSYLLDNVYYNCGNAGPGFQCYKMVVKDSSQQTYNYDAKFKASAANYIEDGNMQVAGATATCFKSAEAGQTIRYCVSSDCAPLYVKYEATENGKPVTVEAKATDYTKDVSESDFTLPATPTGTSS